MHPLSVEDTMQIFLIGLSEKVNTQSIKSAAEIFTIVQVQDESHGCIDQHDQCKHGVLGDL